MTNQSGILRLCFLSIAALFLAVYWFPALVQCDGISFGRIEIIDDVVAHYQVTGIKVYNQSTIYRSFQNKDIPTGSLTKRTVLAKYDATTEEYIWMRDIDTGHHHLVPIFLPCCDERSVIVVFPNCTTDILPFHTRLSGDDSSYTLMIKLDQFGVVVWDKIINATVPSTGGVVTNDAINVCEDVDDTIYLIGPVNRTIPFPCGRSFGAIMYSDDVTSVISQFDHDGTCMWASGLPNATMTSLKVISGDIYVTGVISMDDDDEVIYIVRFHPIYGLLLDAVPVLYTGDPIGISVSETNFGSLYVITPHPDNSSLQCVVKQDFNASDLTMASSETVCFELEKDIKSMDYGLHESLYFTGSVFIPEISTTRAFVAKWNTTDNTINLLAVHNNLSSIGFKISVGNDGYTSVLGRSYSPLSVVLPDYRILSSNTTFNFIAQVLDNSSFTCFAYDSYNSSVCSGRGKCVGMDDCLCDSRYFGSYCQNTTCYGVSSNNSMVCNGKGVCEQFNTCLCSLGFRGINCEESEATISLSSNAIEGQLLEETWILNATISYAGHLPEKVNALLIVVDRDTGDQRIFNSSVTLQSPVQSIQRNVTGILLKHHYDANATIQFDHTTNLISSEVISVWAVRKPKMKPLTVAPNSGAMLYDHFLLTTNSSDSGDILYSFGYFDEHNNRVFLETRRKVPALNITIPILGNITLFAQATLISGMDSESTTVVRVYQGEPLKVTDVLTEQANDLSQTNGTVFESQLTTYTNSLITSIQVITSNQTSQLLNNLISIIQSKQDELSTEVQLATIKTISQQYNYLSESSTVQTSIIVMKSLQRNDSKISDSITVAHNLANVMIATNSSKVQRESFSSMVNVLTGRVRQNMTDGQTEAISLPNLETVISRLNSSSIDVNTTVLVRQPSSSGTNSNTEYVQIVLNRDALSDSGVTFVQGQVITNPPDQYSDKCDTSGTSPTVSTMLFTANQQQIQSVDSATTLTQSSLTLPSISALRNRTDDYQYVCKYLNSENKQWLEDSKVCQTGTLSKDDKPNDNVVVQCMCSQSVSHTVSLDYIQSSETVEVGTSCTNPCGCSLTERGARSKGLKPYAVALIVLACLTLVAAILLAAALVTIKLVTGGKARYELKKPVRAPTDEIERRFDTMYE